MKRVVHQTHYGGMILHRVECLVCGTSFIEEGCCSGCHEPVEASRIIVDRESMGQFRRRRPSKERQAELLSAQEWRCYWCGRMFGEYVISPRKMNPVQLKPHYDHFIPFFFTGSCDDLEFVASCQVCNQIKSSRVFEREEMCRAWLRRQLYRRRWNLVDPEMEMPASWKPPIKLTPNETLSVKAEVPIAQVCTP